MLGKELLALIIRAFTFELDFARLKVSLLFSCV